MKMPRHTSTNKDETRIVRTLRRKYKKVVLGEFTNCRHKRSSGSITWLNDFHCRIWTGDGVRDVYLIQEINQ